MEHVVTPLVGVRFASCLCALYGINLPVTVAILNQKCLIFHCLSRGISKDYNRRGILICLSIGKVGYTCTHDGKILRKLGFRITAFGSVRELIVGGLIVFILQGSAERRKRFIGKIDNI